MEQVYNRFHPKVRTKETVSV